MEKIIKCGAVAKFQNEISQTDLELINQYTRRTYSKDEIYSFNVVLCDNEIDRDNEAFSKQALYEMGKLFVGKTGITNHKPMAENQTARIYSCYVENVKDRKTTFNDEYYRLVAKAYIPILDSTKETIAKIDSGILKEVSVGCSSDEIICSACGSDVRHSSCSHNNSYKIINSVNDVYEWSFVAVPSQRMAGVIKGYEINKEVSGVDIIKRLKSAESIQLNANECNAICDYVGKLEKFAEYGRKYRDNLEKEYVRYSALCFDNSNGEMDKEIAKKLSLNELESKISLYKGSVEKKTACKPQLFVNDNNNEQYYNI